MGAVLVFNNSNRREAMNYREREILTAILKEPSDYTIGQLAEKFHVSERSVRNDIKSINDFLKKTESGNLVLAERGTVKGNFLKKPTEIRRLQEEQDLYDDKLSKNERISVLSIILATSVGYITIAQMAEMLFVSKATMVKDIESAKKKLKGYGITINAYPNKGFKVSGPESEIRKFVWNEQEKPVVGHFIEGLIPNLKNIREKHSEVIRKLVEEQEHAHGYYLTDYSYQRLTAYIEIMLWRIADGCIAEEHRQSESEFAEMAQDIMKYISLYCSVVPLDSEVVLLSEILDTLRYLKAKEKNQEIVHIQIITRQFIEKVSEILNEDLEIDYELFEYLFNHLASVFRSGKVTYPQDSIFYEIANSNRHVFEAVRDSQHILENFAKRELSEVETVYITIHICAALERKKKQETSIRVALVCHGGIGSSQLLEARLKNSFNMEVVGVFSSHELRYISSEDADLIISTIPLDNSPIDYVKTSILVEGDDYLAIKEKLEEIRTKQTREGRAERRREDSEKVFINQLKSIIYSYDMPDNPNLAREIEYAAVSFFKKNKVKEEKEYIPYLHQLLSEEFIHINISCTDWKDAIRKSAVYLLEEGYISESYVEAMIRNVEINGAYIVISQGFAMPHADLDSGSYRTGMNLIRLSEPVRFGEGAETEVQFVCCLCAVDYKTHVKALINLVNILESAKFKKELLAAPTEKEVARIIREYEYNLEAQI